MKLAEIKITMLIDDETPDNEMGDLCENLEIFTDKLELDCRNFKMDNPSVFLLRSSTIETDL